MRKQKRKILFLIFGILVPVIFLIAFFPYQKLKSKPKSPLLVQFQPIPEFTTAEKAKIEGMSNKAQAWINSHFNPRFFAGGYLISWKGHPILEGYIGQIGTQSQQSIGASTPIHIASISKTFTAMAVLKLIEQHKIVLDAPVSNYLPQFNYPNITIKSLLSHRSGLPKYELFLEDLKWPFHQFVRNQDILNLLVEKKASIADIQKPNSNFRYCNTNFVLLALIIEKVTGKSYPVFMKEEVFSPLGMKNSFVYSDLDSAKITASYERAGVAFPFNHLDKIYGDKNIFSTPSDLLIWDEALKRSNFLQQASLAAAYTPYSNEKEGSRNYGLGWRMITHPDGKKLIYHNGWWHGNNTVFLRLLDEDATVIVLGNQYNKGVYKAKALLSLFEPKYDQQETED
jgi:CubicO group peptidase (beta-lactamase class C family)